MIKNSQLQQEIKSYNLKTSSLNQNLILNYKQNFQQQPQQDKQLTQTMKKFYKICFLIIFIDLIMNYIWRQDLFEMGVDLIIYLQRTYATNLVNIFFVMVTMLIDPAVVLMTAVVLMIVTKNKFKGFVIIMYVLANTYITGLLKAFYADPRPIWYSQDVKNIGFYCPQQYGNPSGHSWFSMIMGFGILVQHYGNGKYYWRIIVSVCLCIFVPLSRMYLGAHSLNQVLQGLTMGCCMNILYIYEIRKDIRRFLVNFTGQISQHKIKRKIQQKGFYNFISNYRWIIAIALCHILYIIAYQYNSRFSGKDIPQNWKDNIIKKCGKLVDANHLNFMMLMINSLLVNIATGIGCGFHELLQSKQGKDYLAGKWTISIQPGKQQDRKRFIGYIAYFLTQLSTLAVSFIVAGVIMIILSIKSQLWIFIITNIAAVLAGYLYTTQSSKLLFKYQIIKSIQEE